MPHNLINKYNGYFSLFLYRDILPFFGKNELCKNADSVLDELGKISVFVKIVWQQ